MHEFILDQTTISLARNDWDDDSLVTSYLVYSSTTKNDGSQDQIINLAFRINGKYYTVTGGPTLRDVRNELMINELSIRALESILFDLKEWVIGGDDWEMWVEEEVE